MIIVVLVGLVFSVNAHSVLYVPAPIRLPILCRNVCS
jgi:hypothetical protein